MFRRLLAVVLVAGLAAGASAEEFQVLGPRALGMGGAGVASAQGDVDQYWNPGGLAQQENTSGLQIPVGVHAQFNGETITGANDLYNTVQLCNNNPTSPNCSQNALKADLAELAQGGVVANLNAMVGLKFGAFQLGIINESEVGGQPVSDLVNTVTPKEDAQCANDTAGHHCFQDNMSALNLRAGAFTSANLSYAHRFFVPGLTVGATVKAIYGVVGFQGFNVAQNQAGSTGAFKNLNQNTKSSVQPSVDVGALWDLHQAFGLLPFHPRVGLVGRNLNSPQFDNAAAAIAAGDSAKYTLDRQVRAGIELSPLQWWHLAADADLTKNTTLMPGIDSQMIGAGTEINVFNRSWINIPLRVGIEKDTALSGSNPIYTAGIGLNFLHIILDLGGAISSQTVAENGTNIPNYASASAQLGIMF